MVLLMSGIMIVLISLNILQYRNAKHRDKELIYISKRLKELHKTTAYSERMLLTTGDKEVQALLIQINEFIENNQKSEAQFKKIEQSFKKMLSNVSHDLRTPLTVVLGYIETIQQNPLMPEEEEKRLLKKIHQKTLEIIQLINTFFDLAKLEANDQDVAMTRLHLNEICRKNILNFYDLIQTKGYKAIIQIPDNPLYVLANEEAIERILNNLLSNAIHHGGGGKVIGLSLEYDEQSIFLNVWDKGKGIEQQNQENIFERLFTLEESRNKAFQGSGLGLTITKRLVEAIEGEISVNSRPCDKTTFSIKFKRVIF